jgi:thioredoxin
MLSLQAAVLAIASLATGDTILLDFYADWCGPCRQMGPTIEQLVAQGYPVRKVNVDQQRQLAAQYQVQGIPCFVLLVDGREADRLVGAASSDSLKRMFQKAGVAPGQQPQRTAGENLASDPARTTPAAGRRLDSFIQEARGTQPSVAPAAAATAIPLAGVSTSAPVGAPAAPPSGASGDPRVAADGSIRANVNDLLAASVRLRIEDATGHSCGSGTIIDVRGDQALILTCGHVFRDSAGKGRISVDMFGPGAPRGIDAQVVGYDLDRDVGLISFRPGVPVKPARLAPSGFRVQRGEAVVSIGCDNGSEPSARVSRVSAIDKYLGPPNLEVSGQPVQGRSGGGLFNADGCLIGVCNAADPSDNEGLYAASASIQAILDREGLSAVYRQQDTQLAAAGQDVQPLAPLVDIRPPEMPGSMPRALPSEIPLTTAPAQAVPAGAEGSPTGAENIRIPSGAEVVCVIRSLDDPRAKSQIVVLDRVSPTFLQQVAAEQQRQSARQITSLATRRSAGTSVPAAHDVPPSVSSRSLTWLKPSTN